MYIICCGANGRCVIIGDVEGEPKSGEPCRVANARMVLYWSAECGGLLGLAANGPKGDTRITAAVEVTETSPVTEWVEVSDAAAKAVRSWPGC